MEPYLAALLLAAIVAFVIYRIVRKKPSATGGYPTPGDGRDRPGGPNPDL